MVFRTSPNGLDYSGHIVFQPPYDNEKTQNPNRDQYHNRLGQEGNPYNPHIHKPNPNPLNSLPLRASEGCRKSLVQSFGISPLFI
jgi:hypothetical protein